jgi:hypothetical protein
MSRALPLLQAPEQKRLLPEALLRYAAMTQREGKDSISRTLST